MGELNLRRALDVKRTDVAKAQEVHGGIHQVYGFIETMNHGEATVDVNFPVVFIEKPVFHANGEVGENQSITAGYFPTCNVMVRRWITSTTLEDTPRYHGANLLIVITGDTSLTDYLTIVHWSVTGKALVNPLRAQPT